MAIQVQIKGRLFGNSMFWIFTRVNENIELSRPICILRKMPDSQRVFCIFGQMLEKYGPPEQSAGGNYIIGSPRSRSPEMMMKPKDHEPNS
jgi:hypothetical protein